MSTVGVVESLWRYPVKSMRGEELDELYASFAGIYGDRLFAFKSSGARAGLPLLTGRDQKEMIRYCPYFRNPESAARPANIEAAKKLSPLVNPVSADAEDLIVDVETPEGKIYAVNDPQLIENLRRGIDGTELTLHRSEKAVTDCFPISLISRQTIEQVSRETAKLVDPRRFRANIYLDLKSSDGFTEDAFVDRTLRIGDAVRIAVLARDTRCVMIALDPETAEKDPAILRAVAQRHQNKAGIYGAILAEGLVRKGDCVELID